MYKNLCSIPNRFWESECNKFCSHNYMLFLGSGTDLGGTNSSYVKNVTILKYWCNLQLAFSYLKFPTFCEGKMPLITPQSGYCTLIVTSPQPVEDTTRIIPFWILTWWRGRLIMLPFTDAPDTGPFNYDAIYWCPSVGASVNGNTIKRPRVRIPKGITARIAGFRVSFSWMLNCPETDLSRKLYSKFP